MRKNKRNALIIVMILIMSIVSSVIVEAASNTVNVTKHTASEIRAKMKNSPTIYDKATFDVEPGKPDTPGVLTAASKKSALDMINLMRYIAGVDPVTLDDSYGQRAQAGAFVNWSIGKLTHYPKSDATKPEGMSDAVWDLGASGAGASNIAYGQSTLNDAILAWTEDEDAHNIDRVGHRLWLLNPEMGKTGFGSTSNDGSWYDRYYAMLAIDWSGSSGTKNVAWPAQVMPVEFFQSNIPWSFNTYENGNPVSTVTVKLERLSGSPSGTGTWNFSSANTYDPNNEEYFTINTFIGLGVVFRPAGVTYKPGDKFNVTIKGLLDQDINYTVEFIMGYPVESISMDEVIYVPYSKYLSVNAVPEAAKQYKVNYKIADTSIATVNENGVVTAVASGETTVTATVPGEYTIDGNPRTATAKLVVPKSLNDDDVVVESLPSYEYTGEPIEPVPTITATYNGKKITLKKGEDFEIYSYSNNEIPTEMQDYYYSLVWVRGINRFTDYSYAYFTIDKADISKSDKNIKVSGLKDVTYTGQAFTPGVTVKITLAGKERTLKEGEEYTVEYSNNTEVGTATVNITGTGYFTGTVSKTFNINPIDLSASATGTTVTGITNATYTGSAITQDIVVKAKVNGTLTTLKKGTDYTVSYADNTNAGTATLTITGKGHFAGKVNKTFKISKFDISKDNAATVTGLTSKSYTGSAITQAPTVKAKLNGKDVTLKQGTDFKVSYSNNVKVGKADVTVTGQGNYTGSLTGNFNITRASIKNASVSGLTSATYTGNAITKKPTVKLTLGGTSYTLKNGTDYTLSYKNNVNVGTATVTITGKGNFKDSLNKTFKINPIDVTASGNTLTVSNIKDMTYTGSAIKQSETITLNGKKLTRNTDYTVEYKNNVNAGTATITYKFKGNYTGEKTSKFKISPIDIKDAALNAKLFELESKEYTSKAITQKPTVTVTLGGKTVTLKANTDYTIATKNNIVPGTATVTLTFKGNYKGTLTGSFKITKRSMSHVNITSVGGATQNYTGNECKIEVSPFIPDANGKSIYKLQEGKDYTITYKNNVNVGTAQATITGKGYFKDSINEIFTIEPLNIHTEGTRINVSGIENKEYTGKAITQDETIKVNGIALKRNTDYTISYTRIDENGGEKKGDHINAGKIRITYDLKGNYAGTIQRSFKITPFDISKPEAETKIIGLKDMPYVGGWSSEPDIKVTTKLNGKAITLDQGYGFLTFKNSQYPGTATVTVNPYGNFTGQVSGNYKIVKADISKALVSGVVDKPYTGSKITQSPKVEYKFYEPIVPKDQTKTTLVEGKDYKLTYTNNIKQGTATMTITGIGSMTGTKEVTFKITNPTTIRRIGGDTRYETSRLIGDAYKKDSSQAKFSSIIVACGTNYPDALSASYLAKVKKAPVIIWRDKENANVQAYIKKHLNKEKGVVYLIGGKAVVDSMIADGMTGYKFVRYAGDNRFETNAKVLEAAKVKSGEIIICDGLSFEGALIASATGKPVMLVMGDALRPSQKAILGKMTNLSITIVGNSKMVSSKMEAELKKITKNVTRVDGKDAEALSINVAKKYFKNPKEIVLATSKDFPDGLCGGPLAIVDKGPLFLVNPDNYAATKKHCSTLAINRVTVLGGTGALSDEVAKKIAGLI